MTRTFPYSLAAAGLILITAACGGDYAPQTEGAAAVRGAEIAADGGGAMKDKLRSEGEDHGSGQRHARGGL